MYMYVLPACFQTFYFLYMSVLPACALSVYSGASGARRGCQIPLELELGQL